MVKKFYHGKKKWGNLPQLAKHIYMLKYLHDLHNNKTYRNESIPGVDTPNRYIGFSITKCSSVFLLMSFIQHKLENREFIENKKLAHIGEKYKLISKRNRNIAILTGLDSYIHVRGKHESYPFKLNKVEKYTYVFTYFYDTEFEHEEINKSFYKSLIESFNFFNQAKMFEGYNEFLYFLITENKVPHSTDIKVIMQNIHKEHQRYTGITPKTTEIKKVEPAGVTTTNVKKVESTSLFKKIYNKLIN